MTYLRTTTVIYTTSGHLHKYVEKTENSTYFTNHVDMTTETINKDKEKVVVVNNVRTKSTILTTNTKTSVATNSNRLKKGLFYSIFNISTYLFNFFIKH